MRSLSRYQFSTLVKHTDFIVTDHVLHGVRTMPGVSMFDIIYRYLLGKGMEPNTIQLRNVLFFEPVATTPEFDKKIRFVLEPNGDYWVLTAKSQPIRDHQIVEIPWVMNMKAEVHLIAPSNQRSGNQRSGLDYTTLKQQAHQQADMDDCYAFSRNVGLMHYDFVKLQGRVYEGTNYVLGEVHLSKKASSLADQFLFHPSLLDGSLCTLMSLSDVLGENEEQPFIPMYVESLEVSKLPEFPCYVHVNKQNLHFSGNRDISYADVDVYDKNGQHVYSYKRFGLKRVRTVQSITRLEQEAATPNIAASSLEFPLVSALQEKNPRVRVDREAVIRQNLQQLIADLLMQPNEQIDSHKSFYDIGLDSRHLLEIAQMLENKLNTRLYPTLLFDYNTVQELTNYILREHPDSFVEESKTETMASSVSATTATPSVQEYSTAKEMIATTAVANTLHSAHQDLVYTQPNWVQIELENTDISKLPKGTILLFDTDSHLREALIQRMQQEGEEQHVILVQPGISYAKLDSYTYTVVPDNKQHYLELFTALEQSNVKPTTILHYWSRQTETNFPHHDAVTEQLTIGMYGMLALSQAIMERKWDHVHLMYLFDNQKVQPLYGAVRGFLRTLWSENPKLPALSLELSSAYTSSTLANLLFLSGGSAKTKNQINLRAEGRKLWIQQLSEIAAPNLVQPFPLQANGVYLITGGLGGLGLLFAEQLARFQQVRMILIGRSAITPEKWDKLSELNKGGSSVDYMQADLSNQEEVIELIRRIKEKDKRINGVFHSAGVIRDSMIHNKTRADAEAVLASKIYGTLNLDEALKSEQLDFFVTFSSISAVVGSVGQSDYAFANSFLDHFAKWRDSLTQIGERYGRTLSINWPYWQEGGMQLDDRVLHAMKNKIGITPLTTENGIRSFNTAYHMSGVQLAVFQGERDVILRTLSLPKPSSATQDIQRVQSVAESQSLMRNGQMITTYETDNQNSDHITVLHAWSKDNSHTLFNYWALMKEGKRPPVAVWRDNYRELLSSHHIIHLLVNTPSARNMEVIMAGSSGPILLLICAFATTATMWEHQIRDLSNDYRVICIHTPGYGQSEGGSDFSLSGMGSIFFEVLDQLSLSEPVHLIAASWGSLIAQTMAVEHPERVNSMTIVGGYTHFRETHDMPVSELLASDFANIGRQDAYEKIATNQLLNPRIAKFLEVDSRQQYNTKHLLTNIKVPTLILTGDLDRVVPESEFNLLTDHIPFSIRYNMKGVAHMPSITHPNEFSTIVKSFVEQTTNVTLQKNQQVVTTPEAVNYEPSALFTLTTYYQKLIEDGILLSAGYLLARHGKVFASQAMGKLSGIQSEAGSFKTDSLREIGSISKIFTAVAILQLVERGMLDLKWPVKDILPEFDTPELREITILHLMTHMSGLRFMMDPSLYGQLIGNQDRKAWLKLFLANEPQQFKIDELCNYSSAGFTILGYIIEEISGQSFASYVQRNVLDPLGMNRTFFHIPEHLRHEVCVVNEDEANRLEFNPLPNRAGGGMYSSMHDLYKLAQMLLNGGTYNNVRILGRKSVEAMTRNQLKPGIKFCLADQMRDHVKYGFCVDLTLAGDHFLLSPGSFSHIGMGWSGLFVDPKEDFIAIYIAPTITYDSRIIWPPLNIIWSGLN